MATRWQCSAYQVWRQRGRGRLEAEKGGLTQRHHPLYFPELPLTAAALPSRERARLWLLKSCMILADLRSRL